jgi:hypothetical protein
VQYISPLFVQDCGSRQVDTRESGATDSVLCLAASTQPPPQISRSLASKIRIIHLLPLRILLSLSGTPSIRAWHIWSAHGCARHAVALPTRERALHVSTKSHGHHADS